MGKLTKAAIGVFVINIIAKLLGLIRESVLAYKFGTSFIVDAYTIAITFPSIIFAIFAGGIAESFIPVITRIDQVERKNSFINNTIGITTGISIIMTVLCILLNHPIVELLAPGFESESQILTRRFVLLISTIFPIMIVYNIIVAYLTSEEYFIIVNLCNSVIINIIVIVSIILTTKTNPDSLIWGYIISYFVPLAILWALANKSTFFKPQWVLKIKDSDFRELLRLAIPLGASLVVNQLNSMVDRALASLVGEGIIAALGYANKVQLVFYSLTTSIVMSVCYPRINRHFAKGDFSGGMVYISKGFMIASFVGIPVSLGLIAFAIPITQLIFERGNFDAQSTAITAECLIFYAAGMVFYSYREILVRALAARKMQKLIFKNTLIAIGFNIALSIALVKPFEHMGLAFSTSAAGVLASILSYIDLKRLNLRLFNKDMIHDVIKIILVTMIVIVIGLLINACFMNIFSQMLALLISIFLMMLIYIFGAWITKIKVFCWMFSTVLKKE